METTPHIEDARRPVREDEYRNQSARGGESFVDAKCGKSEGPKGKGYQGVPAIPRILNSPLGYRDEKCCD